MKPTEVKFLQDLQQELLTQDKVCQADPRFWVIMDYKWAIVPMEYVDKYRVYDNEGTSWTLNQFADYVKEKGYDEISEAVNLIESGELDYDTINNIVEEINKYYDSYEYAIHGVSEEPFIVQDTMFLTIREAKEHLKSNHYHYTSKAHVYAMTAWRSPQIEQLITILQQTDFSNIEEETE